MGKLLEIKKIFRLNECRKIEDTEIQVGVFNFSDGTVHEYTFVVQYVRKIPYGSSRCIELKFTIETLKNQLNK